MHSIHNQFIRTPGTVRFPGTKVAPLPLSKDIFLEKHNSRSAYKYFKEGYVAYMKSNSNEVEKRKSLVSRYIQLTLLRRSVQIPTRSLVQNCNCSGRLVIYKLRVHNSSVKLLLPEDLLEQIPAISARINLFIQLSSYQRLHQKPYLKNIPDLILKLEGVEVTSHKEMQLYRELIEKHVSSSPSLEKVVKLSPDNPYKSMRTFISNNK
jgi:hypothetical protein